MGWILGGSQADEKRLEQETRGDDLTHEQLVAKVREIERLCRGNCTPAVNPVAHYLASQIIRIIEQTG